MRWPALWLVPGWVLVAATIAVSLAPAPDDAVPIINDKIAHVLIYAVLATWFAGIYERTRYPLIGGCLIVLGAGLEVAQGLSGYRTAEWADLLADAIGIATGLGLAAAGLGGWCARLEQVFLPARKSRLNQ